MSLHEHATDVQLESLCTRAQCDIIGAKRDALGASAVKVTLKPSGQGPRWLATMHWHTAGGRLQQTVFPAGHLGPVSGLAFRRRR